MKFTAQPKKVANLIFGSERETLEFSHRLAPMLKVGDSVLLFGEIGSGKSFLARAIIQYLMEKSGQIEDVPSPTFTLVQTYHIGGLEVWHSDLYRLGNASEVEELGLLDAFESGISVVEWADKMGDLAPANALSIDLKTRSREGERDVTLSWNSDFWDDRVSTLLAAQQ